MELRRRARETDSLDEPRYESEHHADPIVITATLDATTRQRFDDERAAHFPPGRTVVGAHLTLFHAIPAAFAATATADLDDLSARGPLVVTVRELMPLGNGVAYALDALALVSVHRELQRRWWRQLTKQDRQGFRPHVTVQNKVSPATARQTLAALRSDFQPFVATVTGLAGWYYRGGPWELWRTWPFAPRED